MQFEYKFEPLEFFFLNEEREKEDAEYEGHYEINVEKINELGQDGFELFQVILINGCQHGWFKKSIQ